MFLADLLGGDPAFIIKSSVGAGIIGRTGYDKTGDETAKYIF
jgi:hypothetical protein